MTVSYEQLRDAVRALIPGFEIRYKNESRVMRLFGVVLFFNPRFMTSYITTFGGDVYVPSREWLAAKGDSFAGTLAHEYVHLADARRYPVLFELSYLFPQVLAVFALGALGAFWSLSWLWCLCFLAFLAPIPAPWRVHWERRGYAMTLLWRLHVEGHHLPAADPKDPYVGWLVAQFAGWAYYRMGTTSGALQWYWDTSAQAAGPAEFDDVYAKLFRRLGVWNG